MTQVFTKGPVVVTHGYFLRTMLARVLLGGLLTGPIFRHFQSAGPAR